MSSREPQPRSNHAAIDFRQKLYVWGGSGSPAKIQASMVETFDVPSETWQQPQQLRGSLPDNLGAMAVAGDSESAYFFGGVSGSHSFSNTLYQLNLSTLECKELIPRNPSQAPVKQSGSGMVLFKDKLVVHGGYTGKDRSNELHTFDLKNSECEESMQYLLVFMYYALLHCKKLIATIHLFSQHLDIWNVENAQNILPSNVGN